MSKTAQGCGHQQPTDDDPPVTVCAARVIEALHALRKDTQAR